MLTIAVPCERSVWAMLSRISGTITFSHLQQPYQVAAVPVISLERLGPGENKEFPWAIKQATLEHDSGNMTWEPVCQDSGLH